MKKVVLFYTHQMIEKCMNTTANVTRGQVVAMGVRGLQFVSYCAVVDGGLCEICRNVLTMDMDECNSKHVVN